MEPTNDVILSDQMTYDSEIRPPSYYKRFLSIKPQGAQTVTYSGSNVPIIFEISAGCHNLSKCELYFSINGVARTVNSTEWLPADYCSLFQSIRVTMAQATQDLVYIRDLDLYSKMVSALSRNSQYRPSYQLISTSSNRTNIGTTRGNDNDELYNLSKIDANSIKPYTIDEQKYLHGIDIDGNMKTTNFCLKLSDLVPDSIFSIDKTLWYDNVLRIELTTNIPSQTFIAKSTNSDTPYTPSTKTLHQIGNLRLCYFTEIEPKAIALCKQLCSSCEIHIPLVIPSSVTNPGVGNNQLSYRLSRNPNDRLYKSYHALFKRSGANVIRANCSNFFATSELQDVNRYFNAIDGKWQGINCFELRLNNDVITRFEDAQDYMIHLNQLLEKTKNQHSLRSITSIYNYGVIPFVYDTDYQDIFDYSKNEHKGIDLSQEDCQINTVFNAVSSADGTNTYENYAMYVIIRKCILQQGKFIFI